MATDCPVSRWVPNLTLPKVPNPYKLSLKNYCFTFSDTFAERIRPNSGNCRRRKDLVQFIVVGLISKHHIFVDLELPVYQVGNHVVASSSQYGDIIQGSRQQGAVAWLLQDGHVCASIPNRVALLVSLKFSVRLQLPK
jgi:hypothetical protein